MEASLPRRALAEAIGVFILCTVGNGSVAELVVAGSGTWLGINLCYGIAVALAVYVCGKVSGGHVNPAVTIVEAVEGRLAIKEAAFYILGQVQFDILIFQQNEKDNWRIRVRWRCLRFVRGHGEDGKDIGHLRNVSA